MTTTSGSSKRPMIHELVNAGRMSPQDGAKLMEVRRSVQRAQLNKQLKGHPILWGLAKIGALILAIVFGVRRERS
jgi:hypothetical protein